MENVRNYYKKLIEFTEHFSLLLLGLNFLFLFLTPPIFSFTIRFFFFQFILSASFKQKITIFKDNNFIKVFLIFLILFCITDIYSIIEFNISRSFFAELLFFVIIWNTFYLLSKKPYYIKYLISCFIVGSVALSTYTFVLYIHLGYQESYAYMVNHIVYIIKYIIAISSTISSIILINLFLRYKKKFYLFLAIYLIFVELCFNQSRIGYISEFIIISYYTFTILKSLNSLKYVILILALFAGTFSSIYYFSTPFRIGVNYAVTDTLHYFKNDKTEASGASGVRLSVYYVTYKFVEEDPSFLAMGCGFKMVEDCVRDKVSAMKNDLDMSKVSIFPSTENQYLQGLYLHGIAGLIAVILLLLSAFRERKNIKIPMFSKSLGLIVFSYSIVFLFSNHFQLPAVKEIFFFIVIILISTKYIKTEDN